MEHPRLEGFGAGYVIPYCHVASSLPPTQPMALTSFEGQFSVSASIVFMVPTSQVSMLSRPPTGRPTMSIWKMCLGRVHDHRLKTPTPLSVQYTERVEYGIISVASIV